MNDFDSPSVTKEPRRPWVSPALKNVGTVGDIVLQSGKHSMGSDHSNPMFKTHGF
jgi:hypothetical protein